MNDYGRDVIDWIIEAGRRSGHNRIFLIGHSEGALAALMAARCAQEHVAGVVLAGAPGRALGDVLRDQIAANPANAALMAQAFDAIEKLERGERVPQATLHPALAPLFRESVQAFVTDIITRDPARMIAQITAPALVVQGTVDIQVSVGDAKRLADARPGVELALIKGANHVLKQAPPDFAGNVETYTREDLPISEAVVDCVARFILRHATPA